MNKIEDMKEMEEIKKEITNIEKKNQKIKQDNIKQTKKQNMRKVKIDGVEYMKNTVTGKLYTMPRVVTTRKIMRNRLRKLLKANGFSKVNKTMSYYWKRPDVQAELMKM